MNRVEDVELEAVSVVKAIADIRIHNRHAVRPDAVVFDQGVGLRKRNFSGAEPPGHPWHQLAAYSCGGSSGLSARY